MPAIKDYIYMMVSNDKYELPVYIAETAQELADMVGVPKGTIYSSVIKWEKGQVKKAKYIRVMR